MKCDTIKTNRKNYKTIQHLKRMHFFSTSWSFTDHINFCFFLIFQNQSAAGNVIQLIKKQSHSQNH